MIKIYFPVSDRKLKDFLSFLSDTNSTAPSSDLSPGKAAPTGPKVKTTHTMRKHSTPTPVASTSHNVVPTPSPTKLPEETHSASSTASPTLTEVDIGQTTELNRLCSDPTASTSQCTPEVRRATEILISS